MIKLERNVKAVDIVRKESMYSSRRFHNRHNIVGSAKNHWPEIIPTPENYKRKFKFLNCKQCSSKNVRKETRYRCPDCDNQPSLCPECFTDWHQVHGQ